MQLQIVRPTTPDEVEAYRDQIEYLYTLVGAPLGSFVDDIKAYPEFLTLVTDADKLVCVIEIKDNRWDDTLGKRSLSFGGAIHPDYRKSPILTEVAPVVIRMAFRLSGKRKMLATTTDDNKQAQQALGLLGFRRIGRAPDQKLLYKLERKNA